MSSSAIQGPEFPGSWPEIDRLVYTGIRLVHGRIEQYACPERDKQTRQDDYCHKRELAFAMARARQIVNRREKMIERVHNACVMEGMRRAWRQFAMAQAEQQRCIDWRNAILICKRHALPDVTAFLHMPKQIVAKLCHNPSASSSIGASPSQCQPGHR